MGNLFSRESSALLGSAIKLSMLALHTLRLLIPLQVSDL